MNTLSLNAATLQATSPLFAWLRRGLAGAAAARSTPAASLARGATAWVARPLGRTLRCESGTLWLTFDGEPEDVILEAGASHVCTKASRLSVHAMEAAQYTLR
jgi:Protein of unknown function (DUF2917)